MDCNNPPDSRSTKFLHTFWRVNRNMMRFIHKAALENELSIPQYSILMTIAPRKEMTQKQLGGSITNTQKHIKYSSRWTCTNRMAA